MNDGGKVGEEARWQLEIAVEAPGVVVVAVVKGDSPGAGAEQTLHGINLELKNGRTNHLLIHT